MEGHGRNDLRGKDEQSLGPPSSQGEGSLSSRHPQKGGASWKENSFLLPHVTAEEDRLACRRQRCDAMLAGEARGVSLPDWQRQGHPA